MKKLGIIGCGWLGNHIAERLSNRYKIFATTTTESKIEDLKSKGFNVTLASFPDEPNPEMKKWEVASQLDSIIIGIPFSGIRGMQVSMRDRQHNLRKFLGDYKGQLFLMSSTGVYPEIDTDFKEEDKSPNEVESENFILEKFPQTNIMRLAGLMGDNRLLKNYNISNLDMLVNHIHYADICSVFEKMLKNNSQSKVYNIVAPIHPNKEEVINAQKGLPYSGERTTKGRTISAEKLIKELDFEFQYPDPRYFH
ncbi:hypothetical protein [Epilithonimonas sp.]|uniref:hypothetical protein n=1 Tax=Epilithonimonas sp. TaxID=2894511 RepID=UPI00289C443A|nr:hypothetical protein [Epilithonimonas sp.]